MAYLKRGDRVVVKLGPNHFQAMASTTRAEAGKWYKGTVQQSPKSGPIILLDGYPEQEIVVDYPGYGNNSDMNWQDAIVVRSTANE